jgi:hypothetical protein
MGKCVSLKFWAGGPSFIPAFSLIHHPVGGPSFALLRRVGSDSLLLTTSIPAKVSEHDLSAAKLCRNCGKF